MAGFTWDAPKDPDEEKDYAVDWTNQLPGGDTIVESTWPTVPTGITKMSDSFSNTGTTIWLSGGTANQTYEFVNRVRTAGGRLLDVTCKLKCKTK